MLELWQGNVVGALDIIGEHKLLDATWMALAPAAGHDVWLRMQIAYAEQLETQGDVHGAGNTAALRSFA